MELRAAAALHFPPSALNFHYYFSVRDVAWAFHELCCATGASVPTPIRLVSLWFHESRRVLCDKLASERDAARMLGLVSDVAKKHFEFDVAEVAKAEAYVHGPSSGLYIPVESLGHARQDLMEALQVGCATPYCRDSVCSQCRGTRGPRAPYADTCPCICFHATTLPPCRPATHSNTPSSSPPPPPRLPHPPPPPRIAPAALQREQRDHAAGPV